MRKRRRKVSFVIENARYCESRGTPLDPFTRSLVRYLGEYSARSSHDTPPSRGKTLTIPFYIYPKFIYAREQLPDLQFVVLPSKASFLTIMDTYERLHPRRGLSAFCKPYKLNLCACSSFGMETRSRLWTPVSGLRTDMFSVQAFVPGALLTELTPVAQTYCHESKNFWARTARIEVT